MSAYTLENFENLPEAHDGYNSDPERVQRSMDRTADRHGINSPNHASAGIRHGRGTRGYLPIDNSHYQYTDAFSRHQSYINTYVKVYISQDLDKEIEQKRASVITDKSILAKEHRFVWDPKIADTDLDWNQRLAKRYYDKLFKEYALCDLSRYKTGHVALRWRTQKEVFSGKGQFICGNKICDKRTDLQSWEVNFKYMEDKEKKNVLVKVRLCSKCSRKLNYKATKRKAKQQKRQLSEDKRNDRRHSNDPKSGGSWRGDERDNDSQRDSEREQVKRPRDGSRDEGSDEGCDADVKRLKAKHKAPTKSGRSPSLSDSDGDGDSVDNAKATASNVWQKGRDKDQDELREEEMDDYLQDLFF